jgi:hypothetical protein
MELPAFERTVQLAEQFGPFLFAVLFILVITRTAHSYYRESLTRKNPPASPEERRTYRFYFLCSIWAGLAAMALAIGWWLYGNWRGNNFYQVAILNLKANESISANYFTKSIQRPRVAGGTPVHDVYLLIVRDRRFKVGEKFPVSYYKLTSRPESGLVGVDPVTLEIVYSGKERESYRVGMQDGAPRLIADSASQASILMGTAAPVPSFLSKGTDDRR